MGIGAGLAHLNCYVGGVGFLPLLMRGWTFFRGNDGVKRSEGSEMLATSGVLVAGIFDSSLRSE